ncbi:MAG: glycosyltransferase family 2 protein [Rickettsiales bacterium]|jgi:dolichol-phosphate mannosyltransferase|nr:glycosyltransferase family 2 protein [Rickettsiales bacterium]
MKKTISIVISAYNEEGNIRELHRQLSDVLKDVKIDAEIIFVNDGSRDRTLLYCHELQKSDERVKIVNFTKNFGHETAMIAGMEYARGDAVIFMDADLQHPPRYIKDMLKLWQGGEKIVLTRRRSNADTKKGVLGLVYKICSKLFYLGLNFLSDVKIPEAAPDFRLIDREYIEFLKKFQEQDAMFRGTLSLIADVGQLKFIEFDAPARTAGESKYNFVRSAKLALNSVFQFSIRPLQLAMWFAFIMGALSVTLGTYVIIERFFLGHPAPGYATVVSAITFTGAVILFVIAILGMYVGKIHIETKKRPLYFAEYFEKENKK